MNCKIRTATEADAAIALELIRELALYEKEPEAVEVTLEEFLRDWNSGLFQLLVAEKEGVVVGIALYYIRYSTWKGPCMYLEDLVVSQQFRGSGIGNLLFRALMQEVLDKNYHLMTWQVLDWNISAIKFYKKFGADIDAGWLNGTLRKDRIREFLAPPADEDL